jgi:hypothetical protein
VSALSQLELCLVYQRHWCEHKPSITVTVREDEWMDVGAWVYRHFDEVSGEEVSRCKDRLLLRHRPSSNIRRIATRNTW